MGISFPPISLGAKNVYNFLHVLFSISPFPVHCFFLFSEYLLNSVSKTVFFPKYQVVKYRSQLLLTLTDIKIDLKLN